MHPYKINAQHSLGSNTYQPPQCHYQQLTSLHSISRNFDGSLKPPRSVLTLKQSQSSPPPFTLIECRAPRAGGGSNSGGPHRPRGGGGGGSSSGPKRGGSGGSKMPIDDGPQRLNKALSSAGVASRRSADELIFAGRVAVNGKVVQEPGVRVDLSRDKVLVDGRAVSKTAASEKYYFALNKPKGFICSSKGDGSRGSGDRLVIDLFENWIKVWKKQHPGATHPPRFYTVGRLDVQSVGLIFVTNDGDWAQKVQHPSAGITKEYSVTLNKRPTKAEIDAIAGGTEIDGAFVAPLMVAVDDSDPSKTYRLRVILSEGRNREVRRLVEAAGLEVRGLRRLRIGGYRLPRTLGFGEFVQLKPWEVRRVTDKGADKTV